MTLTTPLVLGSASPRRREILERVLIPHVVVVGDADETVLAGESALGYLERIVTRKLEAVLAALPGDVAASRPAILVADTTVILGRDILGKPRDAAESRVMIERLAGHTHEVATRFAIATWTGGACAIAHAETTITKVTFRALVPAEIAAYVRSGEGADKAGGYAVQGLASGFVSRIEGSYTNVVGLPAAEVRVALQRLGVIGEASVG